MPKFAMRWMVFGWILVGAVPAWTEVDFAELARTAPVERVQQTMDTFAGLGSRVAGYRGADQAAQIVQERFRAIGLDDVTVHEYDVSIPVDKGGFLQVVGSDEQVPIHGLWPNLVKTSTLPEGGMMGRLIDTGAGEYADMDGKQVEGAVALMDFNSGDAWLNAAYLGAQAIIFIEPDSTVYLEGEKKFLSMPLDLPRFWVNRQVGQHLRRQLATEGEQTLHLQYRMDWERRPAWNILGTIPGYDPLLKEDVIVLEAYYDAMSVVPALAPGAEQASGITALLELARYFRENPPARTVVFLATSAHHLGLRGIDDFIQRYLRKEDPFIEHMLVRRVVDAALARNMIAQDGIHYAIGEEEFTSKEALVRGVAEGRTDLAARVADAALAEGLLSQEGGALHLADEQFKDRRELVDDLRSDEDLRLALYKTWVDPKVDSLAVKLFISLDLSSQTDELGVWNSNTSFYYKRYFAPFGKNFMGYARKISRELDYQRRDVLVNGISPEGGMSWQTFVPGEISVNSELVLATGTPALAFVTVNDARFLVDTPLDRAEHVNYANLAKQIRVLAGMFEMAFADPELFPDFKMRLRDTLRSLRGRTMVFPRRSIIPDLPRADAVAVVRNGKKKSYKGVRGEYYEVVDDKGAFYVNRVRVNNVQIEGYYMDPITGRITYAPDRGVQGDETYPMRVAMDWRDKQWMVILFPCVPYNFFDIVDPRYLTKLSNVQVFDETNGPPVEYGYTIGEGPSAQNEPVGVLFARPGSRIKMGFGAGLLGFRSLLLNATSVTDKDKAEGEGFEIRPGTSFARTTFQAAQDMWNLDESRMRELRSFAIENQRLNDLHYRAETELDQAAAAGTEQRWGDFVRHTRAAFGLESRAYPDVKSTQNDVIQGIIFFMALVIPCAFFTERLIFTAATIRNQIIGFAGVFLAIWIVLWLVHPAFQLSNPFVILLAFIIIALAVLVMSIISGRFNEQMKKLRTEVAVIHDHGRQPFFGLADGFRARDFQHEAAQGRARCSPSPRSCC